MYRHVILWMLLCSSLLHAVILLLPDLQRSIGEQNNNTELRLTLVGAQPPSVEIDEPLLPQQAAATVENVPRVLPPDRPIPAVIEPPPIPELVVRDKKNSALSERASESKPDPIPAPVTPSPPVEAGLNKSFSPEPVVSDDRIEIEQGVTEQHPSGAQKVDPMKVWQSGLQQRINQNRRYPQQALRKGLEGSVRIKAVIRPDGTLERADILSGHRNFKASSLKTLRRSLPFPPPSANSVTVIFTIRYTIH